MSDPRQAGTLTGGGSRRRRRRRHVVVGGWTAHMPDIHLSDLKRIRQEVWDFDPDWEFDYSQRDLILMAEKILLNDPKPGNEHPVWLNADQLLRRGKREIYVGDGVPDPSIASGLFNRTHPQGRPFASDAQRRRGSGFYRR